MKYVEAFKLACEIKNELAPFCDRIEIAGSVRRKKPDCGDIEIVCIRKKQELFQIGIESVLDKWKKVKGDAVEGKYVCRIHPSGTQIDVFFATRENWGLIFFIRTGSADFSKKAACRWVELGYHSIKGMLHSGSRQVCIVTPEEEDIFRLLHWDYIKPEFRIYRNEK